MPNIVLFGETGAGKSSVVNLMAGEERSKTSLSPEHCTMQWEEHTIVFDGCSYKVFDTIGLQEPQLGIEEYLKIIENAYNLITKLNNEGGIDLLLFCVRAGRVTATIQNNYRLFHECLCETKVPIVLVLTGLEREKNMEDWWTRNVHILNQYKIHVAGHACVTAANQLDERLRRLYEESGYLVRALVTHHTQGKGSAWNGGEGFFRRFMRQLKELLLGAPTKKDIVGVLTKRCGMPREAAVEVAKQFTGGSKQR